MTWEDGEIAGRSSAGSGDGVLRCTSCYEGGTTVIAAVGEIDWASAPILREHFAGAMLSGSPRVILDLGEVTFLDSSGLSVLICAERQASARQGWVRLVAPPAHIHKILHMTHLDEVFQIYGTVHGALAERGLLTLRRAAPRVAGTASGPDEWFWPEAPGDRPAAYN